MSGRGRRPTRIPRLPALGRLRSARAAAGMSQSEAGRVIGRNQSYYGKIELGHVDLTAREALALCDALGLTLRELLQEN